MPSPCRDSVLLNNIIAEEVRDNSRATADEIGRKVKARADGLGGRFKLLPLDYIINLVRKKMKENEFEMYCGDPGGRDEAIMKELKEIEEDIQRTRPHPCYIEERPFFMN